MNNKINRACCKVFYVDKVEPLLFDSKNIGNLDKNNKKLVGQFSGVFLLRLLTCSNSKSNANCRIIYEYAPSKFIKPNIIEYYCSNFGAHFKAAIKDSEEKENSEEYQDYDVLDEKKHDPNDHNSVVIATTCENIFVEIDSNSEAYQAYKRIKEKYKNPISKLNKFSEDLNQLKLNYLINRT